MDYRTTWKKRDVPFFPLKLKQEGNVFFFRHPYDSATREVNHSATLLLNLCDGKRTWDDIVTYLTKAAQTSRSAILNSAVPIIKPLTEEGIVWWRKGPYKTWKAPPPQGILWDLTNRCNLQCKHCVVSGGENGESDIPLRTCLKLIDQLSAFGVRQLILSGGEPLMRKDFFSIAEYAAKKGLHMQIATNATLITHRKAEQLAELGVHAQVSLDGASAVRHDAFRGITGSWQRTMKGIKHLIAHNIPVIIACTVNSININEIPKVYTLASELGAHTFRILPFVPFGRGSKSKNLEIPPNQMKKITSWLLKKKQKNGMRIAQMEFECTFSPPPETKPEPSSRVGCDGGFAYVTVASNGDVLPCNFFSGSKAENICDHSFQDIWFHSDFLNYFRSITVADIHGMCKQCSWYAACRGSCLAANYAHGDIFQSNVHCWEARELERRKG